MDLSEVSLVSLSQVTNDAPIGAKARNLSFLMKMGYNIPETYVVPFVAFEEYMRNKDKGLRNLEKLLEEMIDESKYYSVRSSANIEDSSLFSFAGQFETHLNVMGLASIKNAVERTWNSSKSEHAHAYASGLRHTATDLRMAVIIQEMVKPEFSGVVFTRNPITGLDEIIVETVDGYGDALVQEGVTPDRWVFKWGNWLNYPHEKKYRESIILNIIEISKEIANKIGSPVDIEWAYDGNEILLLQMRKITTLKNTNLYSNRISREFLPGIILPLVWSVNIPVVNNSWKRLFIELIGNSARGIDINNLAKSFYYRAYFNMGIIGDIFELLGMPREALEILAGIETPEKGRPTFRPSPRTIRYLPRMISVLIRKLLFSKNIELFLRRNKKLYQEIAEIDLTFLDEKTTLKIIDTLYDLNTEASYFVIVSQLLNSIYNMMLRIQLEKRGIIFEDIKFKELEDRLRPINPIKQIGLLHNEYLLLDLDKRNLLMEFTWEEVLQAEELGSFKESLGSFIRRFGHLSDSGNDFSKPTWREHPTLILKMVIEHIPIDLDNEENLDQLKIDTALKKNRMLLALYNRATKYGEYRESVNFLYTFGYGLFRRFFKRMESLLIKRGLLEQADDIFYLTYEEIKNKLHDSSNAVLLQKKVAERKDEIDRFKDVSMPEVIYNELPESVLVERRVIRNMKGVATSRGHSVGPVCIVHGPSDFTKIQKGDILVIPYSDVSWTPLFLKATAVVSESGGILSHCSIVAREYGIPAVVSVLGAMDLMDGTIVAVDGYSGEVRIMKE